jgi:hypothetical protein
MPCCEAGSLVPLSPLSCPSLAPLAPSPLADQDSDGRLKIGERVHLVQGCRKRGWAIAPLARDCARRICRLKKEALGSCKRGL